MYDIHSSHSISDVLYIISGQDLMDVAAGMSTQTWVQLAPYALFVVAAVALFTIGSMRARKRGAVPSSIASDGRTAMMSLKEAANEVYETARRERMVIAAVAEGPGRNAIDWFARSIAGVIPVYHLGNANAYEKLASSPGSDLDSLYIRKRDFPTYVRWARSMQ
jgi:hypothetical protein